MKKRHRYKSQPKKLKCFLCHKQGHFRKDCPDRNKMSDKAKDQGEVSMVQEGYENAEVLCIAELKVDQD
ncbi:Acylamino-acid-releasing enzyme [Dorcoceras hygrometricum]|uniref:Acylamino-acid-releasing enzyme n=1 Tax=Dorcoceras hygrometricum TaxID=472368 RepID=A0A2Z7B7Y9_9LAMI|nr:Acylamino-acid-releasing enzyme [Dorcoceras hygrometricum]